MFKCQVGKLNTDSELSALEKIDQKAYSLPLPVCSTTDCAYHRT